MNTHKDKGEGRSAICGGCISESQLEADIKKYGIWADMMSYVMKDKDFEKYSKICKTKDEKKKREFFTKHARSLI